MTSRVPQEVSAKDSRRARWGSLACSIVPLSLWHRILGVRLLLPYYHVVCDHEVPHVDGLYRFRSVSQFKKDLEFLVSNYTPVDLQDVVGMVEGRGRLDKRCFMLSFDDGFREVHDVAAPILRKFGVPAVFFLVSSAVDNQELCYPQKKSLLLRTASARPDSARNREADRLLAAEGIVGWDLASRLKNVGYHKRRTLDAVAPLLDCDFRAYLGRVRPYLTIEQIRSLRRQGFSFGAHSIDHPLYCELEQEEQLRQTRESVQRVAEYQGEDCRAFAFPYREDGVRAEFFEKAFSDGTLSVSFGGCGVRRHFCARHLGRFGMERTDLGARRIVTRQLGRAVIHGGS